MNINIIVLLLPTTSFAVETGLASTALAVGALVLCVAFQPS